MTIFTRAWWAAAGTRAANTALAALIPIIGLLIAGGIPVLKAASLVAVAALASLLTSLAGLPEVTGRTVTLWRAIISRTGKTFGQAAATAFVGVELIEAVDWTAFYVVVGGAVAVTFLRTLLAYLPETDLTALEREAAGYAHHADPYA